FQRVLFGALGGDAGLADVVGVAAAGAGRDRHGGGEVGDGGVPGPADAVGAAPVSGRGRVGVIAGDGGVAALAAAEDVDAAGEAVFGGVEVLVADDGFDVIQDGDGHSGVFL